jgi:glycosyltransferase involved in cell wall biosynthesis
VLSHHSPSVLPKVLDELDTPALRGRVVRYGAVAPPVVAELLARANIFTLPSRDEPYGMDYTEAMCAGLPIVGWRAGNLPNLIDDGVEGILVPTGNVGALTAAYLRLATETAAASIPSLLSRQGSWHTSMPFGAARSPFAADVTDARSVSTSPASRGARLAPSTCLDDAVWD